MDEYEVLKKRIREKVPLVENELDAFRHISKVIHLPKKEIWETMGIVGRNMGFIVKGLIRQYTVKDGDEFTEQFFMENQFVGNYISYLQNLPSISTLQAIEDSTLIACSFRSFAQLMNRFPNIEKFSSMIGDKKLFELNARSNSLLLNSPKERYYKFVDEHPGLVNRIPQYYIAQYLAIKPQSLSRIRKRHMEEVNRGE